MTTQEALDSLENTGIPFHLRGGLIRYVVDGIRPGSFLCACIVLDIEQAIARAADEETKRAIPWINTWLLTECPQECAGTSTALENWIAKKAKERQDEQFRKANEIR